MRITFDRKAVARAANAVAEPVVEDRAREIERYIVQHSHGGAAKLVDTKDTSTDRPRRTVMVRHYGLAAEAKNGLLTRAATAAGLRVGDA